MEVSYELVAITGFLFSMFMLDRMLHVWERATNQHTALRSYTDVFIKVIDKIPLEDLFKRLNQNADHPLG
jgi:hypothetical protein